MNYYLTKSNPNTFRLQDYLGTFPTTSRWTVCKDAKPGDTLIIGLSGKEAGIYATATIASTSTFGGEDPDFWINPEEAAKARWRANIKFSENLIHCPILEQNLMAIPELKRIAKWLHFQGATCHLTKEEAEAIDMLIKHSSSRT